MFGSCLSSVLYGFNYLLLIDHLWHIECGTPFPDRSVLADPNRVQDALLSLNHSKSNLCGSDFNLGQAHKHLHLTKCIYSEGILCLFKLIYKIDIQSLKCFFKISKFKKKTWNECTYRSILRNFLLYDSILGPLSISIYHSVPAHWQNNTLSIFMLSGSIQIHSSVSV